MANNRTIFQTLTNMFGPYGVEPERVSKKYSLGNSELLRTTSKEEYENQKLQARQNKYLSNQWVKVENEIFQKSIQYEITRIGAYSDFENMEFYPEIAATLDILMEESTTVNDVGRVLNIYSESPRVKGILEDLFFNRLDVHVALPMWIRNMCKYGDNFLYLNTNDARGVTGVKQLPNFEIERREGGVYDVISANLNGVERGSNKDDKVKFFWRGRDLEFMNWQVAHFRLLGDDRRLPYGTCLKGDTRINTEFGVEEISKIKVGTNVWSFNTKTQEKELSPILDKIMSGTKEVFKISTRHNFVDASKEHKILIATEDGDFTYKNVCDLKIGDLLVLNKNEHTNKIISIDKTKPSENKNGWFNSIGLIPDTITEEFAQLFGFLIGDGWLSTNNSCVEFALGTDVETNEYYISLLEKFSGRKITMNDKQATLHSKMLKTVLERMGFGGKSHEKRIPNWVFEMSTELQKAFVAGLMDADGWATRDQWVVGLHIELNNKELIEDLKILLQRIGYKSGSIRSRLRKEPIIEGRQIKTVKESHMITFFDSYLTQMKKYEFKNRKTDNFILEPIQSIESIGEFETYDIYVSNKNHNFYANNIVVHNSILEKARRIWKQLLLSEDAMLVYRVTRAPERRIFKVFVGNIDDEDVQPYVNEIANRFKRASIIDPKTGQIDLRYNQLANDQDYFIPVREEGAATPIDTLPGACVALDTRIPLLDGRTLELSDIIKEWNSGNRDLWVYSCDPNTGELAPGMITWAGETRKNAEVLKITLDNGKSITTTPDHKWVHRTKGFVEAKDLVVGDSLMPFYTKKAKIRNSKSEYKQTWDSKKQKWVYDHRMVANYFKELNQHTEFLYDEKYINENKQTIHHININRYDNNPSNLAFMYNEDHYRYHSDNFGKEFAELGGKALKYKLNSDIEFRNMFIETASKNSTKMWANRSNEEKKLTAESLGYKNVRAWRYFINKNKQSETINNYNHKIISIELLKEKINTGTITVDGNEIYSNYHTFATESGVFIKNSNLDAIADIEYLQRKLFTALRVPKAFLGFDDPKGEGKNLALLDIRFARTVNRIQQAVLQELNKIAIIHLVLSGLEDEIDNFTITMNNPSTQAEMLRIQNLQTKVTLVKDATSDIGNGFSVMSLTKARRSILGWSDEESKQDFLQQRMEKAASAELENTANVIKHTGMFDKVDKLYGDIEVAKAGGAAPEGGGEAGGPSGGGGGGFGGGGLGGGDIDFGEGDLGEFGEGEGEGGEAGGETPEGGGEAGGETPEAGGAEGGGEAPEAGGELAEGLTAIEGLLTERVNKLSNNIQAKQKKYQANYYNRLVESLDNGAIEQKILDNKVKIFDEGLRLNEEIESVLKGIDELSKDTDE